MVWDSLRAHNGCLSLFDVHDLARGLTGLHLGEVKPRTFRRISPTSMAPSSASSSAPVQPRFLLPVLSCEADTDTVPPRVTQGCFLFVKSDSKVQVVRDRRSREDLALAFPDVNAELLNKVWDHTRVYCAASTILTSLINSGHHQGDGQVDLMVDDKAAWPALLASSLDERSEGWEKVPLPDGEEWVLVEEEEQLAVSMEQVKLEVPDEKMPAPRGLSYKDALMLNIMDMEEGEEWPEAPYRPSLGMQLTVLKKPKPKLVVEDPWDDTENAFFEESYFLDKAVGVRARKAAGKKRLTETGKLRHAAKLQARRMAAMASEGDDYDDSDDDMMVT